jgi:predicted metal-dependent hydrolase
MLVTLIVRIMSTTDVLPPADLSPAPASGKHARAARPTPDDLVIRVRDRPRIGPRAGEATRAAPRRWWLGNDPIGTAWHTALSATFPRGEAFFVDTVRQFRDGVPPRLEAEIRAFTAQEVNHAHEHRGFNRAAEASGYDLSRIDARVVEMLARADERRPIRNLAATMALEHFTAIFAHDLLAHPGNYRDCDPDILALWRWHAAEEIEHKGVAFDTWLHATRDWHPLRRWLLRAMMMLVVSRTFFPNRIADTLDLLAQDGLTGWGTKRRLARYLLVAPGVLRRIFPAWLGWFRPGFHPWQHDDRALLADAA